MKIKPGVRVLGLKPEMNLAIMVADSVWSSHGQELVITSAVDGSHSEHSRHYIGLAVDMRHRYFTDSDKVQVSVDLQEALGDDFYVLVEKTHIHMSFKPKEITK